MTPNAWVQAILLPPQWLGRGHKPRKQAHYTQLNVIWRTGLGFLFFFETGSVCIPARPGTLYRGETGLVLVAIHLPAASVYALE